MNYSEVIEKKYAEAVQGIKEEWFTESNSKWYEYIIGLPSHLQVSYFIVVFHNQVFNGGFHQYFVNGYGQFAKETIDALTAIGALKRAKLLKYAFEKVWDENNNDVLFREKLLSKNIKSLFDDNDLIDSLNKLDNEYYTMEEEIIEQLLGKYLQENDNC